MFLTSPFIEQDFTYFTNLHRFRGSSQPQHLRRPGAARPSATPPNAVFRCKDPAKPEWHGWHAFRRGLGTILHDLGVDDKTIQAILRHANVSVTQQCYVKTLPSQSLDAMQRLEKLVVASTAVQ